MHQKLWVKKNKNLVKTILTEGNMKSTIYTYLGQTNLFTF